MLRYLRPVVNCIYGKIYTKKKEKKKKNNLTLRSFKKV